MITEIELYSVAIIDLISSVKNVDYEDHTVWFFIASKVCSNYHHYPITLKTIGYPSFTRCVLELARHLCLLHSKKLMEVKHWSHEMQTYRCLTCAECVCG